MTTAGICRAMLSLGAFISTAALSAQADMRAAYERAEMLQGDGISDRLYGMSVQPNWIGGQSRFWYRAVGPNGSEFVLIDAERGTRHPAFDHEKLARGLSSLTGRKYSAGALPMQRFEFTPGGREIRLQIGGDPIQCDLRRYACFRLPASVVVRPGEVASPDGSWAAFVRDHNLFLRSLHDGREVPLTTDGVADHAYGERPDSFMTSLNARKHGDVWPARVLWSPDARKLITYRVDQRQVLKMPYVEWAPAGGYGARPKVHYLRMPMAGDKHVPMSRLVVFDLGSGPAPQIKRIDVAGAPIQMPYDLIYDAAFPWWGSLWWDRSSRHTYHLRESRDFRHLRLIETDVVSGAVRDVLEDFSATGFRFNFRQLPLGFNGKTMLWVSEKDGWQHLYLHDVGSGRELARVTRGQWRVDKVMHVDWQQDWIYFTASGREPGMDLYYFQLYRIKSDGSQLTRLTPEDAQHDISFSPDGRYFIARASRVDLPPITVLRRADGSLVQVLEKADISALTVFGRQRIERFRGKARDGVTDIYATVYRPSNFDPTRRYPVLDEIYGFPDVKAVSRFTAGKPIAELGFIVVEIDGIGTGRRSKAFSAASYGKGWAQAGGLSDHIAILKQLAAIDPSFDLQRAGVYGYSGGGHTATRAILDYPDFFKVAVAGAGSHDVRLYQYEWGEHYVGQPSEDPEAFDLQANSQHVGKFAGKLLLAHGDIDDDVSVANTLQVVDALIKANKDFDLLIVPGATHDMYQHPYFIRRQWDYFVRHLSDREPPVGYRVGGR